MVVRMISVCYTRLMGTITRKPSPASRVASQKWHDANRDHHLISLILNSARYRAKKRGIPFSVTLADVPPIPEFCPILGIRLGSDKLGRKGPRHSSPSLDRIVPSLGYVPGNVQWISFRANRMKSDASPSELHTFAAWVLKEYPEDASV